VADGVGEKVYQLATELHVKHFTPVSGDMVLVTAERADLHGPLMTSDDL
jgi:hypothetical protein